MRQKFSAAGGGGGGGAADHPHIILYSPRLKWTAGGRHLKVLFPKENKKIVVFLLFKKYYTYYTIFIKVSKYC